MHNGYRHGTPRSFALGLLSIGWLLLPATSTLAVSPEEEAKIDAAVPTEATAQPRTPRKLLVFSLVGGNHTARPYGAMALDLMAKKTGAFEVVHTTDPAIFKSEELKQFDAVCFNNSNRLQCFEDPELQRGLIDFVKSGKGFVGIHAAATNFSAQWGSDFPEGAALVGGIFNGHPWHEKVTIALEEPGHPLNRAFGGRGFEVTDEMYQFDGPHSRDKLRILLRIDETKTDMDRANKMDRPDDDFAVSWVQRFGKGRVFYCSLGHEHDIFWNRAVLRHYLDGIQFALGDLPVDTTPSAAVGDPKYAIMDPDLGGPDLAVQGEYVGQLTRGDETFDCGVQVIALGDGKFHAVAMVGGLPGAGWDGSEPVHADGGTFDRATTLSAADGSSEAVIQDGRMTVKSSGGRTLGTLERIVRKSPTLGAMPPAGAIVLFDGTGTENFQNARMTPEGLLMELAASKQRFQSYYSHIEFLVPLMPYARGQARGNNGYFCQGRYQAQILDSFGLEPGKGECGAIYGLAAPTTNMCLPPLSWQTFDVDFKAAVFKDGEKVENARMTVRHNGVLIHGDVEVPATSSGALIKEEGPEPGPVFVQRHTAPMRFRNIWVVEQERE
ncbi:MAG: ThuA domain-containing protein [Thermoguttaceae bacterium]